MKQIIGYVWYHAAFVQMNMGIVIYVNGIGLLDARIATSEGKSEEADSQFIANNGAKFPLEAALIAIEINGTILDRDTLNELRALSVGYLK